MRAIVFILTFLSCFFSVLSAPLAATTASLSVNSTLISRSNLGLERRWPQKSKAELRVHLSLLVIDPKTYNEQMLLIMQIGDPLNESEIELLRVDFPIPNLDTRFLALQGWARIIRPQGAEYQNPPPAMQLDFKKPVHGDLTALGRWTTKPHPDWSQIDLGSAAFASRREIIAWLRGSVNKKMKAPPTEHGNNCVDFLQEALETLPLDSRKNIVDKFKGIVDKPGHAGLSRREWEDKIWQRMQKYDGWTDGKNH